VPSFVLSEFTSAVRAREILAATDGEGDQDNYYNNGDNDYEGNDGGNNYNNYDDEDY
jgi:hypothetical protein